MSLTGQLADGALHDWCAANLTGTGPLLDDLDTAVAQGQSPVRPTGRDVQPHHWAAVGGAFGQRVAFLVQPAPPYYALLGAHRAGLADWATIQHAAALFPTHAWMPPASRARACQLRPLPTGWIDLDTGQHPTASSHSSYGTHPELVLEFITRLVAYLQAHTPPGQVAHLGAEAGLARACWVLTAWEDGYRSGELAGHSRPFYADPATTVTELRNAAPPPVVDELVALAVRLDTSGALAQFQSLAGQPPPPAALGVAAPVFVDGWADGDVLLHGPAGGTLLDVKTVMSARDRERAGRWLHQLLSYAWLDTTDRYEIRQVGLYLARHGILMTWPVDEFAAALLATNSPADLTTACASFLSIAARAITAEGGDPTPLLTADTMQHRAAAVVQQILGGHIT